MASRAVSRSIQPPKVLPPPSPFGELLRRSNFASYDPAIRQTYTAPASYIHRGNWGLKRPISNRKRHSAIVLRNFEEHAHFIEWDKAPVQVDFIKRVEELNIQPTLAPNSPWAQSLGPSKEAIDSEFCPSEGLASFRQQDVKPDSDASSSSPSDSLSPSLLSATLESTPKTPGPSPAFSPPQFSKGRGLGFSDDLFHFGNEGKGAYGAKSVPPSAKSDSYIQPNIAAMSPQQFEDYLEELRELRPKFMEYIREEIKGRRSQDDKHKKDPKPLKNDEIITSLGAEATEKGLHRHFLGQHTQAKFDAYRTAVTQEAEEATNTINSELSANATQPIQGQPHKLAGLLYSKPTLLETYYTGRAEPGLILQETGVAHFHKTESAYIAAFAGLAAHLEKTSGGNKGTALLNPYTLEGLNVPITPDASGTGTSIYLKNTEHDMRIVELKLETPPKVVGIHVPNESMRKVNVNAKVVIESAIDQNWRNNPHKPGSIEFNNASTSPSNPKYNAPRNLGNKLLRRDNSIKKRSAIAFDNKSRKDKSGQTVVTLDLLKDMVKKS